MSGVLLRLMSLPIFSEGGARAGDTPSHGVPFRKRESHTSAEAGALDAQLRYPFVHAQPGSAPSLQGFPSAGHAGGKGPSTCPACGANVVELRADLEMMQQDRESAVRRLGLDIGLCGMQPFETEVVRLRDVVAKMEESAKCVADAREEEAADRAREVADYDKRLQREEQARQDLEREVRLVRRERDASAAGARHVASDIGEVGAEERRRVAIRIKRLEEQLEGECEKHLKVQGSVKQLEALCTQLEADKGVLAEQAEELSADLEILENEVAELQVLNKTLRQIVDDKEVQVAAMQRYEVEFDHRMSLMVEERDQRLALVERQRETALLRVQELLEEGRKPPGPDDNNMEALSHLVRDKQLEIEDMADHIEELEVQLVNLQHVPTPEPDTTRRSELERHERHVADLKSDAADKDQRIIDLEKKLAVLVEGGSQELLRLNLVLERQLQVMRREVATVKTELSVFLSETADIVHENELLRSLQEVELGEFDLKLKEFKLKDKVTSAKAVALQKQLEDEVAELEEERSKLKRQVRRMSQLAVEKVSVFHDLLPQQVLQLEDIAESLRRGQLELPITDESRELRRTKKELEQRLKEKDQEIIENVSEKVKEYLQNCEGTGVELRVAELEKEKEALREANAALQLNAVKLEQATSAQEEQMANQVAREVAQQIVQHSFQPQVPTDLIDQFAAQVAILERSVQTCKGQGQPGEDKAVGSSVPATPGTQTTGTPSARGAQLAAQCGIVAALTPAVPTGTPSAAPRATPPFVLPGTQLPRELADGSPETIAVLYCQVINCMEELRREQSMTSALTSEVDTYRHKFEAQLADQEVMHGDYFTQRDTWERERRELKDCLASQGEIHETSNLHQRELWHREQLELNEEIASHGTALASVKLELESHRTQILQ